MKKIKTISSIILILLTTVSFAQQEDEWTNNLLFSRIFKNGKMISNVYQNNDEKNIYAKKAFIDDKQQKIFELLKYDSAKDQMITITKGSIKDLKINSSVEKDKKLFIYEMHFNWNAKNSKNGKNMQAIVFERQIINLEISQIFTTINITFNDTKEEIYGWSEENIEPDQDQIRFTIPIFLKVKRIGVTENEKIKDIKDPESKINYALWTEKGFYRYALNGKKDKITFNKMTDSLNTTEYNTIITYENNNERPYMYMNNYLSDNTKAYVSTLDINPFPIDATDPLITLDQVIVWEKFDLIRELYSIYTKQNYISTLGFSLKELNEMEDKMDLLREMITDMYNDK